MFFYPPFARLIQLTFKHKTKEVAEAAAQMMTFAMQVDYGKFLVGPAEPVVNRVRNQFLMELLVKLPKDGELIQRCKRFIQEQVAILHNDKRFRSVVVIADVDAI